MTLSTPRPPRRNWIERFNALEDGTILKTAFFAMLAGTAWVLFTDYQALNAQSSAPGTAHLGDPVLPAIDRPEIDPANPAYRPQERITTPRDILSAPLLIELLPDGILELTGTIAPGSASAFAEEIARRGDYIQTIRLNSPGGSVEDALTIAANIKDKGFDTFVDDGALCASSCPLIFASGTHRTVAPTASVGVHQIYAAPDDQGRIGSAQAMSDAQMITARIVRHFETLGVSPSLWMHALETPPDRLYYLTTEQMLDYGLISAIE